MSNVSPITAESLAAANINPTSFLATDYLNHFNEVVMLMEMVSDMPDMAEDVLAWEPCSYKDHFEQSVFAAKALAIEAYDLAPQASKSAFEAVVADLDARIVDVQIMLSGLDTSSPMDPAVADRLMTTIVGELRPAIDKASGIINATDASVPTQASNDDAHMRAQDAIDEMFA